MLDFANRYREINGQEPIEVDKINFNRAMMVNEVELLEANKEQHGHISEETRLNNHPWIDNAEDELEKMEQDMADMIDLDDIDLEEDEEEAGDE